MNAASPFAPDRPAFKEWHAVVAALTAGRQTLILRKGGIAEGPGGFNAAHPRFWLLPSLFHGQAAKIKPGDHRFLPTTETSSAVTLTAYAELTHHAFLSDPSKIAQLAPHHIWTEATVQERYEWSKPPGVHLLVVRVFRLRQPIDFVLTAAQFGCKSWVTLPLSFEAHPADPVLNDATFAQHLAALDLAAV